MQEEYQYQQEYRSEPAPHYLSSALSLFHLDLPLKQEDLRRAYRTKVLQVHPDVGGTHEEFLLVNKSYNSLLEFVGGAR